MPKPNPFNLELINSVIRSFLGDFEFKVDRNNKRVSVKGRGLEVQYSYDEFVEEIDDFFNDSTKQDLG